MLFIMDNHVDFDGDKMKKQLFALFSLLCLTACAGTEPKIKFYMGVKGESLEDADALLKNLTDAMLAHVDAE